MPNMESMTNGGVELSAESPEPEERLDVLKSSPAAVAATKARGLRRWRRIRRDQQQREGNTAAATVGDGGTSGGGGGRGDEDTAQQHKRRLPAPAGAPKAKHEAGPVVEEEEEGSTASVESRFVPQPPPPAKLDPRLGFVVDSAGFAIGADSDDSDDRGSRSSTSASAPRHDRRGAASLHGKHPRGAARSRADRMRAHPAAGAGDSAETGNSRSSVQSELRSSDAVKGTDLGAGVTGNGVRKGISDSGDPGSGDEGQRSEGMRSTAAGGYHEESGSSVLGRLAQRNADSDDDVGGTLEDGSARNGGLHSDVDPYADSVLLLQRMQEALENEIENFVALGKMSSDEFDIYNDPWSGSVHLEEPIQEGSERIRHQESRLEEVSSLNKEKDSRILELESLGQMRPGKTAIESTNLLLSQSELELLYREKIEAEIQCIILISAYKTLATIAGDQMALYEAQKSLSEDYKQLGLKLRHAENRAMMLKERAEKLQMQCKELSRSSEVLQLRSKASRVSLFCFLQFILLCVAIGTYLMQLVPSSNEFVPT